MITCVTVSSIIYQTKTDKGLYNHLRIQKEIEEYVTLYQLALKSFNHLYPVNFKRLWLTLCI